MELKALRRLEGNVEQLVERLSRSTERQAQLSAALGKSREEVERLRTELQRYKSERNDTRRKVDTLVKRLESLELDWDSADER